MWQVVEESIYFHARLAVQHYLQRSIDADEALRLHTKCVMLRSKPQEFFHIPVRALYMKLVAVYCVPPPYPHGEVCGLPLLCRVEVCAIWRQLVSGGARVAGSGPRNDTVSKADGAVLVCEGDIQFRT